jgi:D-alanyl-D-alanine-carboxypeptidase/D-alanyl-D-alanine-endopeptidase
LQPQATPETTSSAFCAAARAQIEAGPTENGALSSEAIRALLTIRIDSGRDSVGYVAALVDANGRQLIEVGRSDANDERALDGHTVFEIGSITKVFTALLLAEMVQPGDVALSDPVAKYLPPEGSAAGVRWQSDLVA